MSTMIAGKQVGPIGFGLMGLTTRSSPLSHDEACKVMKTALENGSNFWNGGQFYGPPHANSLQLLNHYFTLNSSDSEKVVLSIKGCFSIPGGPDCTATGIKNSIEKCLEIFDGKVFIDIFEPARIDPNVPVEEMMRTLAEYVKAGKIGGIGLSEVNASTIRRAHAVHPISAVEIELSLFSTEALTNGVLDTCAELDIPVVAYSPLSRGWLSGQINTLADIPENDLRRRYPRFQPEVFEGNLKLVKSIEQVAKRKGCSMPQVAIAWVVAMGKVRKEGRPVVVPIPGCTTVERVQENLTSVELNEGELEELEKILGEVTVLGDRYGGPSKKYMNL